MKFNIEVNMISEKEYIHTIEREIELKLSGFQTNFVQVKLVDEEDCVYSLLPSERTRSKFKDIIDSFKLNFKKGLGCYQIPENEVPRTRLKEENFLQINWLKVECSKGGNVQISLSAPVKPGFLLCVAPSIAKQLAEIFAIESLTGKQFVFQREMIRKRLDEEFPIMMGSGNQALAHFFKQENLALPPFENIELEDEDYFVLKEKNRKGNDEQRRFVQTALSTPDFAFLEGPPGSGKTTAIVELLYQLMLRNQRVLLVASTNVAVDNIVEKFLELSPDCKDFCIRRCGDGDNSKISFAGKKFISRNFSKTESEMLKSRLEKLEKRTPEQDFLFNHSDPNKNAALFDLLEENAPIVAGTTFGASLPELRKRMQMQISDPPFDYLIIDEASKTTVQEFLVPAILCRRWIVVGDIKQLPPYVDDADFANNLQMAYLDDEKVKLNLTAAADTLLASKGKCNRQVCILKEKESDYDTYLYRKYAGERNVLFADADNEEDSELLPYVDIILGSTASFEKFRNVISPRITTVRLARDKYSGRILHEEEMQAWVFQARCTREKCFGRFSENEPQEWCDEMAWREIRLFEQRDNVFNTAADLRASLQKEIRMLLPESANGEVEKTVHLLSQIYLPSCMEVFLRGYGTFRNLALFRGFPQEDLKRRRVALSFQHRSHPDIAKIASDEFYEGKAMRSEHMRGKREWEYQIDGERHLLWKDVKGKCNSKNCNKKEQDWIRRELQNFLKFAKKHPRKSPGKWSVAALSFYKEQADELQRICREVFKNAKNLVEYKAGSVDSFQGHEADIVFLSYSNSHPTSFLEAPNRLNVAMTRAKYMMVHVGNFRQMSKSQGALGRVVQKLKNHSFKTGEYNEN